jgi:hypothetical protein
MMQGLSSMKEPTMDADLQAPAVSSPPAAAAPAPVSAHPAFRTLVAAEKLLARLLVGTGVFLILTSLLSLAAFSLVELTNRQKMLASVTQMIEQRRAELAAMASAPGEAVPSSQARDSLSRELARFEAVRVKTQQLMGSGGAARDDELIMLQAQLVGRLRPERGILNVRLLREVRLLPNDALLVILLVACGAIGTAVAAARRKRDLTMHSLGLGMAVGFITFLAINGGKEVFLLQPAGQDLGFNPYSSAFFALMAGLFTERAYAILTALIDSFATRLEQAAKPQAGAPGPPS